MQVMNVVKVKKIVITDNTEKERSVIIAVSINDTINVYVRLIRMKPEHDTMSANKFRD